MNETLDRLAEDLQWRRRGARTTACLDDDVLIDLATGRLEQARVRATTRHLDDCLECLHAYASLRCLTAPMSDEQAETSDEATPMTAGPSVMPVPRPVWDRIFEAFRWRIPLGWSVATAVATAAVVWLVSPAIRTTFSPGPMPMSEFSSRGAPPRSASPASTPLETAPRTIRGTVERIERKDTEGVASYVVILTERPGGATYAVFAWGTPTVQAGQSVQATGVFMPLDAAPPGRYQGVATDVRRAP